MVNGGVFMRFDLLVRNPCSGEIEEYGLVNSDLRELGIFVSAFKRAGCTLVSAVIVWEEDM